MWERVSQINLNKFYTDPKAGFSGINELAKKTKLPIKQVKEFVNQSDTYSKHKPIKHKF